MQRKTFPLVSDGFTRLGLLASARDGDPSSTPIRLAAIVVGSTLIGGGVALYLHAHLGLTPYDVFLSAITHHLGISHGQAGWMVAAALFAIAAVLGRRPALASVTLIVANGLTTDLFDQLLPDATSPLGRVGYVGAGLAAMVVGVSLVVHTNSTGGPFELLMSAAEDRGRSATTTRTALEVGFLALGIAAGGRLGPATVLFGLMVGPSMRRTLAVLSAVTGRSGSLRPRRPALAPALGRPTGAPDRRPQPPPSVGRRPRPLVRAASRRRR